ncbi:hypothetical protein Ciccas_002520 [Cichlidogyrus casuarinus]|uniref:Uncharacterized protein n=1 Tax=Cichlidogyrus casuarinus TaxID=1844966 RepID=A0ABD2QH01_9PLAT
MQRVSLADEMEPHLEKLSGSKRPPLDPDASPWTPRQDPDDLLTPTNPTAPTFQMESSGSTPVSAAASPKATGPDVSFGTANHDADSHNGDHRGHQLPRTFQPHRNGRRKQNLFSACMNMGLTSGDGASLRDCPMVYKAPLVHRDPQHLMSVCEELLKQHSIVYRKKNDPPELLCEAVEEGEAEKMSWIISLCKIKFRNNFGLTFKATKRSSKFETFKGAFISQMKNSLSRPATHK